MPSRYSLLLLTNDLNHQKKISMALLCKISKKCSVQKLWRNESVIHQRRSQLNDFSSYLSVLAAVLLFFLLQYKITNSKVFQRSPFNYREQAFLLFSSLVSLSSPRSQIRCWLLRISAGIRARPHRHDAQPPDTLLPLQASWRIYALAFLFQFRETYAPRKTDSLYICFAPSLGTLVISMWK